MSNHNYLALLAIISNLFQPLFNLTASLRFGGPNTTKCYQFDGYCHQANHQNGEEISSFQDFVSGGPDRLAEGWLYRADDFALGHVVRR